MTKIKRVFSLILAIAMLLGMSVNSSLIAARNEKIEFKESKYKIVNKDGRNYKVYSLKDASNKSLKSGLVNKGSLNRYKRSLGNQTIYSKGDPLKSIYKVKVNWTVYDLEPNKLGMEPFKFKILDNESEKIIAETNEITGEGVYNFFETEHYNDPDVSKDAYDWQIWLPAGVEFEMRLGNQLNGTFPSEDVSVDVEQYLVPLYKAEYFTNAAAMPKIEAQRNDDNNRKIQLELNDKNIGENEYNAIIPVETGLYYKGDKITILKGGGIQRDSLLVSDDIIANRCYTIVKVPGMTDYVDKPRQSGSFTNTDSIPYHYAVTGNHLDAHIVTVRQDLKVNFDPNGAEWKNAPAKDQVIGHSMKLGDSWAGLGPINAPTASDIKEDTIPKKEENGNKVDQVFVGWSRTKNGTAIPDMTQEVITEDTTFYAVYAPKAQGKIRVEYKDMQGQPIDAKYKLDGKDYPAELTGNTGEAIKDAHLNGAPEFLGYEYKTNATDPVPNPPQSATYEDPAKYTLIYKYNKLPSVIPEKEGNKTNTKPNGYVTVTFKAGNNGKINGDTTDVKYFVNPKDDVKFGDSKIVEPTVEANDTYDVKDPKWNPEFNDAKKAETIIADATFTAQYEKQKGTVVYVYDYKNTTSVADPSKNDIPTLPIDSKVYEVGSEVTAETTIATGKTISVKDNSGTVIGNWTFSGWAPAKLTIKKNDATVKNEFKGTWTFSEAGKHNVTYEFQSGTNGVELPQEVKNSILPATKADQYEGTTVTAPTETYAPVEIKTGDNPGTWTFDGWYAKEVKDVNKGKALEVTAAGPNKFIGVWTFEKAKSKVSYKFEYETKDPNVSKAGIPQEPTDVKEYEVGTKVTPQAINPTSVEVKDGQGNVIGIWSFQGWDPKELTVKLEADKNVFTGKWLFAEKLVMSHKYVVEGTTTLPAELKAPEDVYIAKGTDYKPEDPKTKTYEAIEDTTDGKFYDYTFKSWDPAELKEAQEDKEFTGTWTRVQSKSAKPQIKTPIEGDKVIEGKGKPGADIEVTIPGVKNPIPTKVDNGGKWKVDVPADKELKSGEKIVVKQTEKGKTPSESTAIVKSDKPSCMTPAPEINPVYDSDEYITGRGIAGAVIEVRYRDYPILRTKVDTFGEWEVYTPYPLEDEQFVYARQIKEPCDPSVWVSEEIRYDYEYWRKDDKKEEPKKPAEIKKVWTPAELNARDHFSYIKGYGDNTFGPNRTITRAEVAMIFARLSINQSVSGAPQFKDVKAGDWYKTAVDIVARQGVVKGYEDGTFRPNQPITRREFAAIAARYAGNIDAWRTFRDVPSTDWAYTLINRVGGAGWITGYEDNTFRPNNLITRAEVVAIVNRMLNRKADKAYVDNNLMRSKHSFIDNLRSAWYFYDVHEAAVGHSFERQPNGVDEKWNRVNGQAFEIRER